MMLLLLLLVLLHIRSGISCLTAFDIGYKYALLLLALKYHSVKYLLEKELNKFALLSSMTSSKWSD